MDHKTLRLYDIRGEYPEQITKTDAFALGAAYARSREARVVVTAHDDRHTSEIIYYRLIEGLTAGGAHVIDTGPATIDLLTFATATYEHEGRLPDGGIMVTAGRNAETETGFKIIGREGQAIAPPELEELVAVMRDIDPKHLKEEDAGTPPTATSVVEKYVPYITHLMAGCGNWPGEPDKPTFKVLIDPANDMQRAVFMLLARSILGEGFEHITFAYTDPREQGGCEPDPFNDHRMGMMQGIMQADETDFGISFDADGGGFAVYGKNGVPINPAYVGAYIAALVKGKDPNAKVVIDHRAVYPMLYTAQMEKIETSLSIPGSAPMRHALKAGAAQFGTGADGRYYFGDFWWTESGMLGAWMILHLAYLLPQPIDVVVAGLKRGINAVDEAVYHVPEPEKVIDHFARSVESKMNVSSLGPHEIVARSKEKNLDFRVVLRRHEADGTLRLYLEGNGVSANGLESLHKAFCKDLESFVEPA